MSIPATQTPAFLNGRTQFQNNDDSRDFQQSPPYATSPASYSQNDDDFNFGVNLGEVEEPENNFSPIPAGKYVLQSVNTELATTKTGGKMIKLQLEVMEGDYMGRKIFESFNVQNDNHQTVLIALAQIKQLLTACSRNPNQNLTLNLMRGLEGIEFVGHVSVQKDKSGQYGDQNRIRKYERLTRGGFQQPQPVYQQPQQQYAPAPQQAQQFQQPPAAQQFQPQTGGKLPWQQ